MIIHSNEQNVFLRLKFKAVKHWSISEGWIDSISRILFVREPMQNIKHLVYCETYDLKSSLCAHIFLFFFWLFLNVGRRTAFRKSSWQHSWHCQASRNTRPARLWYLFYALDGVMKEKNVDRKEQSGFMSLHVNRRRHSGRLA